MHFLLTLLLQIGVILITARAVGLLFRRIRQPQVMGEMVAGILLGPSLLGWLAPGFSLVLFPPESLPALNSLSQVGLLFFMFLIGLELDPKLLRGRGETAIVTSHVSIIAPFFLGALLALYLYPRLSDASVGFTGFALFMGAAMSITAFPVLARILTERNLLRTKVGAITIACAAVDDVTAWSILAIVIAVVRSGEVEIPLWLTFTGTALYIVGMFYLVRPGLQRLEKYYESRGRLTQDILAVILLLLLTSAFLTEWIGIHALFGAFTFGAMMPRDKGFVRELTQKLEDVTVVFLLPLFFAFTGLRTSIGLVSGAEMWFFAGLILFVAVLGKFGGSTLAARLTGLGWREAGALGVLMNTRGLMELVILTIGLELGVISPALFAMMVMMALVTTFMTTPLLEWIYPARMLRRETVGDEEEDETFTVLLPVSLPSSGPGLLRVAKAVSPRTPKVYALHLARTGEQPLTQAHPRGTPQDEVFAPLRKAAEGLPLHPISFVSRDPAADIGDVAHLRGADLIVMGWHKPVVSQSILGGTVYEVLKRARVDVAVYYERIFRPWKRVLVPFRRGVHDLAALELATRIGAHGGVEIVVLHVVPPGDEAAFGLVEQSTFPHGVELRVVASDDPLDTLVRVARDDYDLVVAGVSEAWGLEPSLFSARHERLARECPVSLLIVRKYVEEGA